ncbi:MAG: AAA family ATPase [Lentisphaeria bacterium]|nr:AAA family ATPase [Lentisphaeria bacterium]
MKREIQHRLESLIGDEAANHVVIVEGARQVGKSYLVGEVLRGQSKPYFSFDLETNDRLRRQINATEDFDDFCALMSDQCGLRPGTVLFFDEAQECPVLARYVKSFKEDLPNTRVILTGSSMNRLFSSASGARVPVGRTRSLCVFPFSFTEFIECTRGGDLADFLRSGPEKVPASRHRLCLELFDQYMIVGGYPEAVIASAQGAPAAQVIDEIMAGMEEDFQRKEACQPELFRDAVRAVANHVGSPSKLTHFGTTKYHAKRILAALQAWHIVLEIQPYSLDPKHSSFLPKRYLHDIGVVTRRRTLAVPELSLLGTVDPVLRTPLGGLFENAVLLGLVQGESARFSVGTWKKSAGSPVEVDFVMDVPEQRLKVPVECKATLEVKRKHTTNLLHYLRLTGQRLGILVSAAPLQLLRVGECCILNVPAYLAGKQSLNAYVAAHSGHF